MHWVAGNVPVLGLLSLVQAMLCKNANVVKVSRNRPGMLPYLLAALSEVTYTNAQGETFSGRVLTDTMAVVYADRQDAAAARELSRLADVRVAWGGREAVEAIINLPRRYGTEDIVFGPKLSFAIVGAERLADSDAARRTAAAIAADACAFDQQGCNSPHTVFVERGGPIAPAEFARLLGEAMEAESRRAPLEQVDPAAAMNVLAVRTEYAMRGEAHHSRGIQWAVVYSDEDHGTGRTVLPAHAFRAAGERCFRGGRVLLSANADGRAGRGRPPSRPGRCPHCPGRGTMPCGGRDADLRRPLGWAVRHGPPGSLGERLTFRYFLASNQRRPSVAVASIKVETDLTARHNLNTRED